MKHGLTQRGAAAQRRIQAAVVLVRSSGNHDVGTGSAKPRANKTDERNQSRPARFRDRHRKLDFNASRSGHGGWFLTADGAHPASQLFEKLAQSLERLTGG
jgi:hypothetical protein